MEQFLEAFQNQKVGKWSEREEITIPAMCRLILFDTKMWSMREAEVWCIRVGLVMTGSKLFENIDSKYVFVSSWFAKFKMSTLKSDRI